MAVNWEIQVFPVMHRRKWHDLPRPKSTLFVETESAKFAHDPLRLLMKRDVRTATPGCADSPGCHLTLEQLRRLNCRGACASVVRSMMTQAPER